MFFFRGKDKLPYGLDLQQSESLRAGETKPACSLAVCALAFPSSICSSFDSTREEGTEHRTRAYTSPPAEHQEACALVQTFIQVLAQHHTSAQRRSLDLVLKSVLFLSSPRIAVKSLLELSRS